MSKQLEQKLRELKNITGQINPDRSWVSQNKKNLLSQISNTVDAQVSHTSFTKNIDQFLQVFAPKKLIYASRPLFIALLAVTVTASSWVVGVSASEQSLPGEALYGLKLAAEKTEVTFATVAGDKGEVTKLHLEFAGRRSEEVKKVVEKSSPDSNKLAGQTIQKLQKSIENANEQVKGMGQKNSVQAVVLAKDVSKKTAEISQNLQEAAVINKTAIQKTENVAQEAKDVQTAKDALQPEKTQQVKDAQLQKEQKVSDKITQDDNALAKQMLETKKIVTQIGLDALKDVLVNSTNQGNDVISETDKKDIANLVSQKIEILQKEIKNVQDEAQAGLIKSVDTLSQKIDVKADLDKKVVNSTSQTSDTTKSPTSTLLQQPQLSPTVKQDVVSLKQAVQKITSDTDQASDTLLQAKELVTTKQIIEAIEKIKEITEVQQEVSKKIEDTKQAVKDIAKGAGVEQKIVSPPTVPVEVDSSVSTTQNTVIKR